MNVIVKCSRIWSLAFAMLGIFTACENSKSHIPNKTSLGPNTESTDDTLVSSIVEDIRQCPAWTSIAPDDIASKRKIMQCLEQLAAQDTSVLREAIKRFALECPVRDHDTFLERSKLFVLNRYIFNVPRRLKLQDIQFFGSFRGIPHDDKEVDMLWPLEIGDDGKLHLTGEFRGYLGSPYHGVEEFDYFNQQYGRRKISGTKNPPSPNQSTDEDSRVPGTLYLIIETVGKR